MTKIEVTARTTTTWNSSGTTHTAGLPIEQVEIEILRFAVCMAIGHFIRIDIDESSLGDVVLKAADTLSVLNKSFDFSNTQLKCIKPINRLDEHLPVAKGNVAIGASMLFMADKGFIWSSSFASQISTNGKRPDYFTVSGDGVVAVVEVTGSQENDPTRFIKAVESGLKTQIYPWLFPALEDGLAYEGWSVGLHYPIGSDAQFHVRDIRPDVPIVYPLCTSVLNDHYIRWFNLMGLGPLAAALYSSARTSLGFSSQFLLSALPTLAKITGPNKSYLFPYANYRWPLNNFDPWPGHRPYFEGQYKREIGGIADRDGLKLLFGIEESVYYEIIKAMIMPKPKSPDEIKSFLKKFINSDNEGVILGDSTQCLAKDGGIVLRVTEGDFSNIKSENVWRHKQISKILNQV